ncbi:MAG: hypothetical protein K0R38_464 [Polyangiaceae bacterium]|nr:hypothetical protein [Polyangiaceae bacterium]
MPKLPWLVVLRALALLALGASAALLSDYMADSPSFCGAASGCGAVRRSALSHVSLGSGTFVPLPAFGVAGFAALYIASLLSRRLTQGLAAIGAAVALYLLYVQALELQQFCWLCVTADVSAVLSAGAALGLGPSTWEEDARSRLRPWAWWAFGALALGAPLLWPRVKLAPPVPAGVLAYYRPGKINVVEFADFQCPACRRFAGILKGELAPYGDRVHFVRLNKPLASHVFAEDAARAAVCAEAQGRAEPMADALFQTEDLSRPGIAKLASGLGLDASRFDACVADPATSARVERESALLVPPELEGLPTTYIGGKRLLGVQSAEAVADALKRAERGQGNVGVSGYVYMTLVALLTLAVLRFGLRRSPT